MDFICGGLFQIFFWQIVQCIVMIEKMFKKFIVFLFVFLVLVEIIYVMLYNDYIVILLKLDGLFLIWVFQNLDCGFEFIWLIFDKLKLVLYCLNEGWGGFFFIIFYRISVSGIFEILDVFFVFKSFVVLIFFVNNSKFVVVYQYVYFLWWGMFLWC